MKNKKVKIKRMTKETKICVTMKANSKGDFTINTGDEFFDHMLSHIAKHGLIDIKITAKGDDIPDYHHLVEDVGIVLGQTLKNILADKKGINRYGFGACPMDESLVNVSLDISGRPYLVFNIELDKKKVGVFDEDLIEEFLRAFVNNAGITLHINKVCGKNPHHIIESTFKSLGRALREALKISGTGIPSTKGSL